MGLSLDKDSLIETLVGVTMTIAADEFAPLSGSSLSAVRTVFE
jgi:hypothetical protein